MIWVVVALIVIVGVCVPGAGWWLTRRPRPADTAGRGYDEIDRWLADRFGPPPSPTTCSVWTSVALSLGLPRAFTWLVAPRRMLRVAGSAVWHFHESPLT